MAVRTQRLGFVRNPPASSLVTIYTVPAGRRTIIKEVMCSKQTGASVSVVVTIVGSSTYGLFLETSAGTSFRVERWTVLNAGDTIAVLFTTASTGNQLIVSGTELVL